MIDQERFIGEFGPHILHYQADVLIDRNGLYERGTLSGGIGWQIRGCRAGRGAVVEDLRRALPGRVRRRLHHRARGPRLRVPTSWSSAASSSPRTSCDPTACGQIGGSLAEAVAPFDGDPRVGAGTGFGGAPGGGSTDGSSRCSFATSSSAAASRSGHRAGRVRRRSLVRRRQGSADARVERDPGYIDGEVDGARRGSVRLRRRRTVPARPLETQRPSCSASHSVMKRARRGSRSAAARRDPCS